MDFDLLIRESIKKLSDEFEIRKSLFLNILHRNVDILVLNSSKWFGDNVPIQYIEVLNSLVNLSVSYFEQAENYHHLYIDHDKEVFNPIEILNEINIEFSEMMKLPKINIDTVENMSIDILTSKKIFRDSLFNVFLCLSPYINQMSTLLGRIYSERSSVKIELSFLDLDENIPDLNKLSKLFYSIGIDEKYDLRIGLNIVMDSFKSIGAVVNFISKNDDCDIICNISLPSYEFLKTVTDIRNQHELEKTENKEGKVALVIEDKLTEFILRDNLNDMGYDTKLYRMDKIKFSHEYSQLKTIIFDYNSIFSKYKDFSEFLKSFHGNKMVIILKSENNLDISEDDNKNIMIIKMPFEIDTIINYIG